jgi:hypothetical protein
LLLVTLWRVRSPKYIEARREEWQAVLSDKLGVDVNIGRLEYPSWNTAVLEDVRIVDPETSREWITARYLELLSDDGTWRIVAGQPEINATALPRLQELLSDRLLRGRAIKLGPIAFSANEVTFRRDAQTAQTLQNVSASIHNIEHGKRAEFHFHLAGEATKQPLEFVMERRMDGDSPRTLTAFHSGESEVLLDALHPLLPWLATFGKDAHFRGGVVFESDAARHTLEAAGTFRQVDLDQLIALRLPHYKLSGNADIQLEHLQLHNGAIALAKGTVRTNGGGEVSRSLIEALSERLDLAPKQTPQYSPQQRLRYGHLAFGFQLDASGLAITGDADPSRSGVIMANATGPLLMESERATLPTIALVQALSPVSETQVPATPETQTWFNLLPPPPALLPSEEIARSRPNVNVRLQNK